MNRITHFRAEAAVGVRLDHLIDQGNGSIARRHTGRSSLTIAASQAAAIGGIDTFDGHALPHTEPQTRQQNRIQRPHRLVRAITTRPCVAPPSIL